MIYLTDEMLTRLNEEMDRQREVRRPYRYSYKDMLGEDVLNYKAESRVSEIFTGANRNMKEYRFYALCKHWGVRPQYLMCDDNFRTEDAYYTAMNTKRDASMDLHLQYLGLLGYTMEPRIFVSTTPSVLKKIWLKLKPTLTAETLGLVIDAHSNLTLGGWDGVSELPQHVFNSLYAKTVLDASMQTEKHPLGGRIFYSDVDGEAVYYLEYRFYKDGRFVIGLPVSEMMEFNKIMDNYSRLSFETFISH